MARFLLLFVDGIGLARETPRETPVNPFVRPGLPALEGLTGGPLTLERVGRRNEGTVLAALDATLGVPGLPQSATGQTALFTGINAPQRLGRHVAAFPGPRLAEILAEHSVLRRAAELGRAVTFANPFSRRYFDEVEAGRRRHSATTLAALASGTRLRDLADLAQGRACAWDVRRDRFRAYAPEVEPISAREAGAQLAALAGEHDLTLWETFMTDLAGHRRHGWTPAEALGRLDGLFTGLIERRAVDLTLLVVSDHGNLEEPGHRAHTRNPVPLLALGPEASRFADLDRLDQLAPRLLSRLAAPPV